MLKFHCAEVGNESIGNVPDGRAFVYNGETFIKTWVKCHQKGIEQKGCSIAMDSAGHIRSFPYTLRVTMLDSGITVTLN